MATHEGEELKGQVHIWEMMFAFADSMALRCAAELRISDIIHSHGRPITITQIASDIELSESHKNSLDIPCLTRVMRLLVRKGIFTAQSQSDVEETLYGLTHSSRWLLRGKELTLAPIVLMETHASAMSPWHCFSRCVTEDGFAFEKAHGHPIWDFTSQNPEFNRMFNEAMTCTARITMSAILEGYEDGFSCIRSLVDIGGGTGAAAAEVTKFYPHIKAINFDLPHVIATAPIIPGVSHVGGDMFKEVPNADAVFMKWIMHDWGDEDCVKILRNCRRAIPDKTGKVIIVDVVLQPEGDDPFDNTGLVFDLVMVAHSSGGKERTEPEWRRLLLEAGFPRYRIIKIPTLQSIIEAYVEI